jgi:excisionase family DNA binding protein
MSVTMRGQTYYRTAEVCAMAGVSRSTLLRWLRRGILKDAAHRDRRGWRLFADSDVSRIADESQKIK